MRLPNTAAKELDLEAGMTGSKATNWPSHQLLSRTLLKRSPGRQLLSIAKS